MNERTEWKDVKGYEGLYKISEYGDVKSLKRRVNGARGKRVVKEKILKPNMSMGYKKIHLSKRGKVKQVFIHRLVAKSFIRDSIDGEVVNHIDGDKLNNHFSNLEWCSYSENNKHAREIGLWNAYGSNHYLSKPNGNKLLDEHRGKVGYSKNVGELNGMALLNKESVLEIRKLYKNGNSMGDIAKVFGVSKTSVHAIISKKNWKHIS